MKRRADPLEAASLMVSALAAQEAELPARWLVVGPGHAQVAFALEMRRAATRTWCRVATEGTDATAGPAQGAVDAVALRLPRGRAARNYALELCAARLEHGGELWAYGPNEEGAKSAGKALRPWFEHIEAVDAKKHCRLWRGVRTGAPAAGNVSDHFEAHTLPLPGGPVVLDALPGAFAAGKLDPASAMLLGALQAWDRAAISRVLDYGCGIGVLTVGVRQRWPDAVAVALDHDACAVAATQRNVPDAKVICGAGWGALRGLPLPVGGFDLVVSNPPLHTGNALDLDLLDALIEGAADRLRPGGHLVFVTQRQRKVAERLAEAVGTARVLAEDGRFRVWHAVRR